MIAHIFQAVLLLALAAGAALLTQAIHPRAPAFYLSEAPVGKDEVNLQQIQERWQGDVIWLDARTQEVYEKGHIPGAHLVNEQGFQEQLLGLLDIFQTTDKAVIIYCDGEKCEASRNIHEQMKATVALEDLYILKGGYPAWKAAQK